MRNYKNIGFAGLIILLFSVQNLFSQNIESNPDFVSIKTLLNDTIKINKLVQFTESIIDTIPIESRVVSEYGLKVSKEIKSQKGEALFNNLIGISYYNVSEPAYAMEYYLEAIAIYEPLLKENGADEQLKRRYLQTINNIAIIYSDLENYEEALKYFSICLQYTRQANDEKMMAVYLNNMGRILILSGKYDEGRKHLTEAIQISDKNGYERAKAFALSNLGELETIQKNYKPAIDYYTEAINLYERVGEKYEAANNYYEVAKLYLQLKDYQNSSKYADILSSQTELLEDIYMKKAIYYINSENEFAKGNYKSAYEYRVKYGDIADTITKGDKERELKFIKVQQELFKTEKENQTLQKEFEVNSIRSQKNYVISGLIMLILITVTLIFIIKARHVKKINGILNKNFLEIEKQNNSLDKLNALKDKLLSIISHDLRSPFTTLLGYSDLLLTEYHTSTEEERFEYIESIASTSKNTFHLLENILYWARSQSNGLKADMEIFEMKESLTEVLFLAVKRAKNKNIKLKVNIPFNLRLNTDKQFLNIIVRNLLNNAIKYSDENSEVIFSAEQTAGTLRVSIKDSGEGISAEQFRTAISNELVKSTTGTDNETGTGFGLRLCNELIEYLSGKFYINTEYRTGTEIIFSIPSVTTTAESASGSAGTKG